MRLLKRVTARKAAETFIKYAVVVGGALSTVEVPEGHLTDKVLLTVGLSAMAAVIRAINNVHKTNKAVAKAALLKSASGYLLLVALSLALAGCVTTTAPDGTVTTSVDSAALSTAWDRYERLQEHRDRLEQERARADLPRRVEIDAELHGLGPEIDALAERLGVGGA